MDVAAVESALRQVGVTSHDISEIVGGWAFWTFDVDGELIARFPRRDDTARAAERELALLPDLGRHVSFAVPLPAHRGVWENKPFFVYPRIAGRELAAADARPEVLRDVGRMLHELHSFPVGRAARLLQTGQAGEAWRGHFERLWATINTIAIPCMDSELAATVEREFRCFLSTAFDFPHCLIHNDLGLEHILVNASSAIPVGLIDFESAWVGDPAVDFVPLHAALGSTAMQPLLADRDLGDGLAERMWFYRWMGSVHAIIYGVREGDAEERKAGLIELRRRLDARP